MPWKEVTPVSERLSMCKLAGEGGYSISKLARDFGVSRKTVYKWLDRYNEEGAEGIFDKSRRPLSSPTSVSVDIIDAVVKLKNDYPDWGPRKLRKLLVEGEGDLSCSRSTVERILARHGLREIRQKSPVAEALGRFERAEPNDLWQIDFTSPFSLSSGAKIWPVPILDDHDRFVVALLAAPACTTRYALEALRSAATRYGMPGQILSDHGGTFGTSRSYLSEFTAYVWACGAEHIQGRYAHPQTQGKLERFNKTLRRECILRHDYDNIEDWGKCFEEYRHIYNNIRPHESLCDATPGSLYKASARAFSEPDRNYREAGEGLAHRKVGRDGKIWILQHHVKVSSGLAGWTVSARHDGGGIWTILFRGRSVCQVSLAKPAPYKPRP
jgi:transposase InsO family protein